MRHVGEGHRTLPEGTVRVRHEPEPQDRTADRRRRPRVARGGAPRAATARSISATYNEPDVPVDAELEHLGSYRLLYAMLCYARAQPAHRIPYLFFTVRTIINCYFLVYTRVHKLYSILILNM